MAFTVTVVQTKMRTLRDLFFVLDLFQHVTSFTIYFVHVVFFASRL